MSIAWGPALDAEVQYRHQQVRSDFFRENPRTRSWHRAPARPVSAPRVPARPVTTGWIIDASQHPTQAGIPVQPVPTGAAGSGTRAGADADARCVTPTCMMNPTA